MEPAQTAKWCPMPTQSPMAQKAATYLCTWRFQICLCIWFAKLSCSPKLKFLAIERQGFSPAGRGVAWQAKVGDSKGQQKEMWCTWRSCCFNVHPESNILWASESLALPHVFMHLVCQTLMQPQTEVSTLIMDSIHPLQGRATWLYTPPGGIMAFGWSTQSRSQADHSHPRLKLLELLEASEKVRKLAGLG